MEPVTGTAPTAWAFGYVGACHSHLLVMVAFIRPRTGDELNEGVTVRPEIGFIIVRSSPWGEVKCYSLQIERIPTDQRIPPKPDIVNQ